MSVQDPTKTVADWICNDPAHIRVARDVLRSQGSARLREYLITIIGTAKRGTAAHRVRLRLSNDDLRVVDWQQVADQFGRRRGR